MKLNRIINGEAIDIMNKMDPNSIHALVTDPPYNYEFIGKNWDSIESSRRINRVNNGKTLVKNIPYGSGLSGGVRNKNWYKKNRRNIIDYENWCTKWGKAAFRILKPGALLLAFNSSRTSAHLQVALENAGFYARDVIVWRRNSGIPRGLNAGKKLKSQGDSNYKQWEGWHSALRTEWESIVVVQKPLENNYLNTLKKYNTGLFHAESKLSEGFQSDIIEKVHRDKKDNFNDHPTVKPLNLMKKLVNLVVPKDSNNIIIDPFSGSGTTLLAAKELNVNFVGIEIDNHYVNIAKKRLNSLDTKQEKLF